jgi:hypothetical protein
MRGTVGAAGGALEGYSNSDYGAYSIVYIVIFTEVAGSANVRPYVCTTNANFITD